jgi:hypothetical protein
VYLAMIGIAVAAVVWLVQRYRGSLSLPASRSRHAVAQDEFSTPASVAYGPESGPGLLRLTPSQLVFESAAGRVVVIERLAIVGVGSTRDLPDHSVAHPVLVVTTAEQAFYFAVSDALAWIARLG